MESEYGFVNDRLEVVDVKMRTVEHNGNWFVVLDAPDIQKIWGPYETQEEADANFARHEVRIMNRQQRIEQRRRKDLAKQLRAVVVGLADCHVKNLVEAVANSVASCKELRLLKAIEPEITDVRLFLEAMSDKPSNLAETVRRQEVLD